MRTIFLALAALVASLGSAGPAAAAEPVYVIRHLPKAAEGADPPLTAEGHRQADALAALLAGSGIKALFATPTRRAVETAEPLAKRLGLKVTMYDPRDPAALVAAATAIAGPVLVVGHSNTVPDLVARFGGAPAPVIGENDYGTIFVVDAASKSVRQLKVAPAP